MTDEAKTRAAWDSPASGENRYTDRYDLYRWFKALEDARDGATGFVGSAELEELWRGWFEATTRSQAKLPTGPENDFVGSMAPLWKEMAEDLSAEMLSGTQVDKKDSLIGPRDLT